MDEHARVLSEAGKAALRQLPDRALNAEARPDLLDAPITPLERFFVRNNGTLPIEAAEASQDWSLTIDGLVDRPLVLSLSDLRTRFEIVEETAVLECAGNGRSLFSPTTDGLQWGLGAVGCAVWRGVRLSDLLQAAGVRPDAVYSAHLSPDVMLDGSGRAALSRGLPIAKATSPETLVAFGMNGAPLPALHGGPLRIVAPGFPGSAWQKWLTRIWLRDVEHDGEKMTGTNYRLPRTAVSPGQPPETVPFDVITDMPPRAMITQPPPDFRANTGERFEVRGFAWSGHVPVASVDMSIDDGRTWRPAALDAATARFGWRRFRCAVSVPEAGQMVLMARATDVEGRSQPLGQAPWNPRGYCNNGVQRVHGAIVGDASFARADT